MPRLLVVHHSPSPTMHDLLGAAVDGASTDEVEGVEVVVSPALSTTAHDALHADAYLLGTPANIGWMSGALKHFFDTVYYSCLDVTAGRPWALYVHGNDDTSGAIRSVEKIVDSLGWKAVAEPVSATGPVTPDDRDACWELGARLAATLAG